ncbi:MAG: hypothetical protein M1822_003615 [Bathelium mastoideum]|nr:MAG: hypothetical protein M1822_003615 [Bathelium mastoideum]
MSKVVRSVKNVTKGYSSVQVKVRNATSNDPWGPVGTDMAEIAQLTFNNSTDFYEIMDMLDKRLNDKGKNWRHVLKSLKVLDYCLHEGSELVVTWARKNVYIIKTLREFQYIDEDGRDVGQNVRVSAKELTSLILDEERLRAERQDRKSWKSRVTGIEEFGPAGGYAGGSDPARSRPQNRERHRRDDEDDLEYRLAIEASKNEAEEDKKRRERNNGAPVDDDDLAKAIKLSKEEEELRRRELEDQNSAALFDDFPTEPAQPQPTGYNQGYQQQGAVDWYGNLVDQQQPQNTGYLNNAYAQPTGFQPQQTGFQNGYGTGYGASAQPAFDQFGQQQQQQQQQQQNYVQPQQTSFNPWASQSNGFNNQQQPQQQQPLQQQNTLQPGTNNPWASSNPTASPDAVRPQPTGSNNPFASSFTRPQPTQQQQSIPSLSSLAEQKTQTQFNNTSSFNPPASFPSSSPPQAARKDTSNPQHAQLNALLATGEGQDTFGNVGNLRIPAQHTAPGTFVNSAGAGFATKLQASQTGNNPFFSSSGGQFVPQQTGFVSPQGQQGQGQGHMVPSQTGPAGAFGAGRTNPFGGAGGAQQGGGGQGGGNLIDF